MKIQTIQFWGLCILLASVALPLSVKPAPLIVLESQGASTEGVQNVIVCTGCNPLVLGYPLDINQASVEHLQSLPFIGAKRALDIVSHRQEKGAFRTLEDLDAVRGIGPKTIQRIQPYIRVELDSVE